MSNPYSDSYTDQEEELRRQIAEQLAGEKPPQERASAPDAPTSSTMPVPITPPGNPFGQLTLQAGTEQPGQKPGPVAPSNSFASSSAPSAGGTKGWGYDSPTGGRKEFSYTPQDYGSDMTGFSGFSQKGAGSSDPSALKNVYRDVAMGLGGGEGGFTEADVDETVRRLNAMGIPATKVDPYQIDFGLGEGPMQVRSSGNEVWWNNRATEGQPEGGQAPTSGYQPTAPTVPEAGGGDSVSAIQALIQQLMSKGYSTDAVMALLNG